jgi:hypothetical protein
MRHCRLSDSMLRYACFPTLALLGLLVVVPSCTTIAPRPVPAPAEAPTLAAFSHADFDRVLRRFVNDQGQVDYNALQRSSDDLQRYYQLVSTYSPDSHPMLFLTEQSKLAYWLNAYNAAVMTVVLTYYPITGVGDIRPPWYAFFLPDKSGFFVLQRVTFGGRTTNLYFLEHRVIRQRFNDPRIHFALNCASGGCPRLPQYAFSAERLDDQLDHETRKFLAEERNLTIDHHQRTISLSSIFDWYESDFLSWLELRFPGRQVTLLDYVALYVSAEKAVELQLAASYAIRFVVYDWRLNDQRAQ